MAILSDFFLASPGEITPEVLHAGPGDTFPVVSATSFTTLEMALLLHVVQGDILNNDDDAVERMDEFEDVHVRSGGKEAWLDKFPDALRDALAAASEHDLAGYAIRWADAEELGGIDQETLTAMLKDLGSLAQLAQAEGKDLYLWFCL